MPLTDAKLKAIQPQSMAFTLADSNGLFVEVLPTGRIVWRYRYSFNGKQEKLTFGKYPELSLKAARLARDQAAREVAMGNNPVEAKRQVREDAASSLTVEKFFGQFTKEQVSKVRKDSGPELARWKNDILPQIGALQVRELSLPVLREVIWRKKEQGFDMAAKLIHGSLKRFCDYAVTCGHLQGNPVASIPARHVSPALSRERNLSPRELGIFLRAVDGADINRALKCALRLLLLTMTRKKELRLACWKDVLLEDGEWHIPIEHSKTKKPHVVYLSRQAVALFKELQDLAGDSPFVLPGRWGRKPYAEPTINNALDTAMQGKGIEHFTVHDLRRTGATLLAEEGHSPDVIEKALNHTAKGVRAVYNRAEYKDARQVMLQAWADYIDNVYNKE